MLRYDGVANREVITKHHISNHGQVSLILPGVLFMPRYIELISNNIPCPAPLIAATVRGIGNLIATVVAGEDWIVASISIFEVMGIS